MEQVEDLVGLINSYIKGDISDDDFLAMVITVLLQVHVLQVYMC